MGFYYRQCWPLRNLENATWKFKSPQMITSFRLKRFLAGAMLAGVIAVPAAAAEQTLQEQGAAILEPFKSDLKKALQVGMQEGPQTAVNSCRMRAPEIAVEQTDATQRVGRTSHKLRNPANAPEPWMQAVLDQYLDEAEDRQPVVVQLGDGWVGYAEPIILQPMCVACHGQTLEPRVTQEIRRFYTDDQAIGFKPGDLRGIFWAEFSPVEQ
jgi:hypothetical protein